jgi:hypothetical protein
MNWRQIDKLRRQAARAKERLQRADERWSRLARAADAAEDALHDALPHRDIIRLANRLLGAAESDKEEDRRLKAVSCWLRRPGARAEELADALGQTAHQRLELATALRSVFEHGTME